MKKSVKKSVNKSMAIIVAAMLSSIAVQANAALLITEVAPWASGNAPLYATDWFELTNTGASALNISGWQMDDSSNGSAKVALTGIASIAAGESVIFTENAATAAFLATWFGASAPAALQVGNYTGAGIGLSTAGDAINIFDALNILQANVTFAASDALAPYQTFDNAAGLNNAAISTLSVAGVNGAFLALNDINEIGSPGQIAAAVPESETYVMLLAGLGFMGFYARKRQG